MIAIAIAGESFGAFVYPVAVFVYAVCGCYGWEGFGDAAVEGLGFGFFVAHDWVLARLQFGLERGQRLRRSVYVF